MSRQAESKRMQRARKKRRRLIAGMVLVLFAMILVAAGAIFLLSGPKVEKELTLEAGSKMPAVTDFLKKDYKDVKLVSGLDESVNMNAVADYNVVIEISGKKYTSVLHVVDTVKPVVQTKDATVFLGESAVPEDFIESVEDATETAIAFVKEPDMNTPGEQEVQLTVTDQGGNVTEVSARAEVAEDTEPPVIEGVKELTAPVGGSVSYKRDVTVSDNYDTEVSLTVDTSQVDLNTIGNYPVVYIATDKAGNETRVETVLHVEKAGVENATEEMVNAAADKLLAKIITDDMSQYDKAKAIFDWIHANVGYYDHTKKTTWVQGAYYGLIEHYGDCFVYASTSKCLLTRAGIKNMDIGFVNPNRTHYWNLIDLGEGWYHFDATRRTDGSSFFYCTDEEVMAYSKTHQGSHAYDPSEYPDIQ